MTLELRGGITGLVGSNGAGKSTLLKLAAGHLRPGMGRVSVCGEDAWSWRAKRLVGYCPDSDAFYEEMTGRQFVEQMARLGGFAGPEARRRTAELMERVGMADRCDRPLRGYSKGMRQRVKLAQALLHEPRLLILDEPLSGIDPVGRQEFLELFAGLADGGTCLLVSSHELDALEKLTDHVAIMARGRLAAVGMLARIRDLLDEHPVAVRIDTDQPRELAVRLLDRPDVLGVDFVRGPDAESGIASVVVRARHPRQFYPWFQRLVIEEGLDVRHLEPLDDSAESLLGYLLGGRG